MALRLEFPKEALNNGNYPHSLKIPEVWRYTEQQGMIIYQLRNSEYTECEFSPTFPMISGAVLVQFLKQAETEDDNSVIRALRQWLRS